MTLGGILEEDGSVVFEVWAPHPCKVVVEISRDGGETVTSALEMTRVEGLGKHSCVLF